MSAFLVEDVTINTVVNWLDLELPNNYYLREELEKVGYMVYEIERLAKDMFQLNIEALNQRYGSSKCFRNYPFTYKLSLSKSEIQVLKSLQCWLYQCSEGTVVNTKLYRLFDEIVKVYLMSKIIGKLPEYGIAKWG